MVLAQAKPKVVVIGGGAGGATAAKYIAKDSAGAIEVTLVEPLQTYQTCFHSNLFLGGFRDYRSITHNYKAVAKHGVKVVHQRATTIDRDKKTVMLANGAKLPYDRLVVSPGIDLKYDSVPGWSQAAEEMMPHAWKPGAQTQLLKKRLDAVPNGGVIVMIAPPNPYRCPPGPYERVSMMAHALKSGEEGSLQDLRHRSEGKLLQAGAVPGRLGEALQEHGRVARAEGACRLEVGRPQDRHRGHGLRDLQERGAGQCHPGADGRRDRARRKTRQRQRVLRHRPGEHEVGGRSEHFCARRCVHRRRYAEIRVLRQQSGKGRGDGDPWRVGLGAHLPGALHQHLLEPDRDRRLREGRRRV